jgi:tRNA(fMet)-specific endonuclease VapC
MSFLLDTDICSAHLRRPPGLAHRFIQYGGRLHLSTVTLGELYAWAHRRPDPQPLLTLLEEFLSDIPLLAYDRQCAWEFGRIRGRLLREGVAVGTPDLMIAAVALAHDLTLVTHNTSHFRHIPGLQLTDWLTR